MVAKSRKWMFAGGFHGVIFNLCLLLVGLLVYQKDGGTIVNAQGPANAGALYLDQKEANVKAMARSAALNNDICGRLDECSTATTCSRVTCHPLGGGRESLQCTSVDNNEFFGVCGAGACRDKMLVDYSRSYVTLPAPASSNLATEVARDICLQRALESTFKTVSVQSEYSLVYFGSSSGAFRAFPGREQNKTQCTSFDPRWRPWYLNGVAVARDVKILVDVASSMGDPVTAEYPRPPQTTYLNVTIDITLGLLQTFSPGDHVEVLSFDNGTAASLGGAFLVNSSYDYFKPFGNPELAPLVTNVNKLKASIEPAALSDLNGAILKAAYSFNKLKSLKVIIVLSNGLFLVNSSTFPALDLLKNQAKLMVYKLPTNGDGEDPFLLKTSLQKDICSVNGSFELLDALATANPLYSMRRYFTFLAHIQLTAAGGNATWSNKYASVSQDQNAITPTYPAFGSDGLLIGVAGIDVVIDNLDETLRRLVSIDFARRNRGTLQPPAHISMTCYYQNAHANPVCPGSPMPDSSTICPQTDTSSTLTDLTCCGTCGPGSVTKESGLKPWHIALISVAAATVIAIAVGIYYWKTSSGKVPVFIYTGD